MRVLIFSQATLIAIPFKSLPELAAVADVLGTLAVSVAVILMALIDNQILLPRLGPFFETGLGPFPCRRD